MKFLYTLLTLAILSTSISFAQTKKTSNKFKWGEDVKVKSNPKKYIGLYNGQKVLLGQSITFKYVIPAIIFTFIKYKGQAHLVSVDKTLNVSKQVKLNTKVIDGKKNMLDLGKNFVLYIIGFPFINLEGNNLDVISWRGNKLAFCGSRKEKGLFYKMNVDFETGELSNLQEIIKVPANYKDIGYPKIVYSVDSSIMCYYVMYEKKGSNMPSYAYVIYDDNMKQLAQGDFEIPYKDDECYMYDYKLNNQGEFYILCKYAKNKKAFVRYDEADPENNFAFLMKSGKGLNDNAKEIKIVKSNILLADYNLDFDNVGNPNIMGTYRLTESKKNQFDGIFVAKIDADNKVYSFKKKQFDEDFINDVSSSLQKDKNANKALILRENLRIDNILTTNDGGHIGIAYNYHMTYYLTNRTSTVHNGNSSTSYTTTSEAFTHTYGNITIFKFDENFKFQWWKVINREFSMNSKFSDIPDFVPVVANINDSLVQIIYQDNVAKDPKKASGFFSLPKYDTKLVKFNLNNNTYSKSTLIDANNIEGVNFLGLNNLYFINSRSIMTLAYKSRINFMSLKKSFTVRLGAGRL